MHTDITHKIIQKAICSPNDKTFCFSRGFPEPCTGLFSPTDMSSLQQLHSTFCSHSAKFSMHSHTGDINSHMAYVRTCTHSLSTPLLLLTDDRRPQDQGRWRAVEAEGKKIHVCLDSIQMCYVGFNIQLGQKIIQNEVLSSTSE